MKCRAWQEFLKDARERGYAGEDFINWKDDNGVHKCEYNLGDIPLDAELIFQYKDNPDFKDYEDSYEVHYKLNDKYYIASDSHCSCDGYQNFNPEQYDSLELYMQVIQRKIDGLPKWQLEGVIYCAEPFLRPFLARFAREIK